MSTGGRILIAVIVCFTLAVTCTIGLTAAAVYRSGSVHVAVSGDGGDRVNVRVPAGLTHLAIALVPDDLLAEASRELGPYWPTIREVGREFSALPDFTLLEVVSRDEQVRVRKEQRRLIIEVQTSGERVEVDVPLGAVERLVRKIDRSQRFAG